MRDTYQQRRRALGSAAEITLVCTAVEQAESLFARLWHKIDEFEARFSRFLESSELSRLNAAQDTFVASQELVDLLRTAQDYYSSTDGLFNPSILPSLTEYGYSVTFEEVNTSQTSREAFFVAPDFLQITIKDRIVRKPQSMQIDLGGLGKGYLLDQLSQELAFLSGFWISIGGDILLAGKNGEGEAWKIEIENPYSPTETWKTIETTERLAVATSATHKRRGKNWHHIIDPRTGKSSESNLQACTIMGPSATTADVLASCCIIAGSEDAEKLLSQFNGYRATFFPTIGKPQ